MKQIMSSLLIIVFAFGSVNGDECERIRIDISKYSSISKSGIAFTIIGVLVGTTGIIMYNSTDKGSTSQMPSMEETNKSNASQSMIRIAIPVTVIGTLMTVIGISKKNKKIQALDQRNCTN